MAGPADALQQAHHRRQADSRTRDNLAERLTWALKRAILSGADEIAVHHSAIRRCGARHREADCLKQGKLWVAVRQHESGTGHRYRQRDSVIFVHPPGGVVRLLQRVGRSGHRPGEPKRGLLLTPAQANARSGRDSEQRARRADRGDAHGERRRSMYSASRSSAWR